MLFPFERLTFQSTSGFSPHSLFPCLFFSVLSLCLLFCLFVSLFLYSEPVLHFLKIKFICSLFQFYPSKCRPTLSVPSKENPGYGLPPEYREAEDEDGSEESVQSQEPKPIDVLLGPVPVKRTKKDDRQAESVYFILEQNEEGQKESS